MLIDPYYDGQADVSAAGPSVFVATYSMNSSVGSPTIYRLTPADTAWSSFTWTAMDNGLRVAMRMTHNPADGRLYAVGLATMNSTTKNPYDVWKVRFSADQGYSWFDDGGPFFLAKNYSSSATGIATDSDGTVYVTGYSNEGRGPHWIIRRKHLGGAWTTVCDVKGQNNTGTAGATLCAYPGIPGVPARPPAIIAVGQLNGKWTILRSQNQGSTWQQVDSWAEGGNGASAHDVACDTFTGNLYAAGCVRMSNGYPSSWLIRMSADGGSTWTQLLNVPGNGSWASALAIDGVGNVSVTGVVNPTGTPVWKVIRCTDPLNPASWSSSFNDTLPLFGGTTGSKGRGITADATGNLFVVGEMWNWTAEVTAPPPADSATQHVGLVRLMP